MQANLFTNQSAPDEFEEHELAGAQLREYPNAFSGHETADLFRQLQADIPWCQDSLWIAGKKRPVPRLQCWMGEACYGYSGLQLNAVPWQSPVQFIKQRVESLTGYQFNSVLLNYYRDGQDSVAWHADDEKELGPEPVIASLSLGVQRPFELRPKPGCQGRKVRIDLADGSLLLMGKTLQQYWLHQIPKVKGLEEARINLTFRTVLDEYRLKD